MSCDTAVADEIPRLLLRPISLRALVDANNYHCGE